MSSNAASRLGVRGLVVAYPGERAVDGISLDFRRGEVHALAGENGAGKSTLIRVLVGNRLPDHGSVVLDDEPVVFHSAQAAVEAGVVAGHQELQIFPHLTVWENVAVRSRAAGSLMVRRNQLRQIAHAALNLLGDAPPLDIQVQQLSPAERQLVAIAAALVNKAAFLILDEPTANLSKPERDRLLTLVRRLADQGTGVILITHHMEETFMVADRVTVMRDGREVWTKLASEIDEKELATAMVGSRVAKATGFAPTSGHNSTLRLADFSWGTHHHRLNLELRSGDILGVAGLPGSGADSFLAALFGYVPRGGSVQIDGDILSPGPRVAVSYGMGYVPPDRQSQALFMGMSVADNLSVTVQKRLCPQGIMRRRRIREALVPVHRSLRIQPAGTDGRVMTLSGGNQQKVLIGRWLLHGVKVLLADEPTRGVDVATKKELHTEFRQLADNGAICAFHSSDLKELTKLADRLLVLRRDGSSEIYSGTTGSSELLVAISGKAAT